MIILTYINYPGKIAYMVNGKGTPTGFWNDDGRLLWSLGPSDRNILLVSWLLT